MRVKPDQPAGQDLADLGNSFVNSHVIRVEVAAGRGSDGHGDGSQLGIGRGTVLLTRKNRSLINSLSRYGANKGNPANLFTAPRLTLFPERTTIEHICG